MSLKVRPGTVWRQWFISYSLLSELRHCTQAEYVVAWERRKASLMWYGYRDCYRATRITIKASFFVQLISECLARDWEAPYDPRPIKQ